MKIRPIDPSLLTDDLLARWGSKLRPQDDGCTLLDSYRLQGYAIFTVAGSKFYAHRVAWVIAHGEDVPQGLVIDHLCRTRACVEPTHLEPVPQRLNVLRGNAPSAIKHRLQVCSDGHDLSVDGARLADGRCRECAAVGFARRRRAAREAAGKPPKTPAGQCGGGHDLSKPEAWTKGKRPKCRACENRRARERYARQRQEAA